MRQPIPQGWQTATPARSATPARQWQTAAQWSAPRRGGHSPTYAAERRHNRQAHLRRLWPLTGGTLQRWR